jgi:predicted RNA-binding Zn-ribbon protein involved in translation (DUF1610 family)
MFRCPHCGQAQIMPTKLMTGPTEGIYLINSDVGRTGFGLDKTFLADEKAPANTWKEIDRENPEALKDIIWMAVECPKCHEVASSEDWFRTWNDPLTSEHLESENLCHCGGELWMDRVPNVYPPQYAYVCDKCQWVKPRVRVSGE